MKAGWGLLKNSTISTKRVLIAKKSPNSSTHKFAHIYDPNRHKPHTLSFQLRKFCHGPKICCSRSRGLATSVLTRSEEDEILSELYRNPPPTPQARQDTNSTSLDASVLEWLQHDEDTSASNVVLPTVRFDWRKRATSRRCPPSHRKGNSLGQDNAMHRTKYTRRVAPPQVDVQLGEPFYHAIEAYKNR